MCTYRVPKNCKPDVYYYLIFNYKHYSIILSLPVLKLMLVVVQTPPVMQTNGIAHIMKQLLRYLHAFLFNGCSQFSNCCRFDCVDFVFQVIYEKKFSGARSNERGGYSTKPSIQSTCVARSHQKRI